MVQRESAGPGDHAPPLPSTPIAIHGRRSIGSAVHATSLHPPNGHLIGIVGDHQVYDYEDGPRQVPLQFAELRSPTSGTKMNSVAMNMPKGSRARSVKMMVPADNEDAERAEKELSKPKQAVRFLGRWWKVILCVSLLAILISSLIVILTLFRDRTRPGGQWPAPLHNQTYFDNADTIDANSRILTVIIRTNSFTADITGGTIQSSVRMSNIPASLRKPLPGTNISSEFLDDDKKLSVSIQNDVGGTIQVFKNDTVITGWTSPIIFENGTVLMYPYDSWDTYVWLAAWEGQDFALSPLRLRTRLTVPGVLVGWNFEIEQVTDLDTFVSLSRNRVRFRDPALGDPRVGICLFRIRITRSGMFLFYPTMQIVAMWLVSLMGLFLAMWLGVFHMKKVEAATVGYFIALIFALPAFRNTAPLSPPVGSLLDVVAFYWAALIAVIGFLAMLIRYSITGVDINRKGKKKKKNKDDDAATNTVAADGTGAGGDGGGGDGGGGDGGGDGGGGDGGGGGGSD